MCMVFKVIGECVFLSSKLWIKCDVFDCILNCVYTMFCSYYKQLKMSVCLYIPTYICTIHVTHFYHDDVNFLFVHGIV